MDVARANRAVQNPITSETLLKYNQTFKSKYANNLPASVEQKQNNQTKTEHMSKLLDWKWSWWKESTTSSIKQSGGDVQYSISRDLEQKKCRTRDGGGQSIVVNYATVCHWRLELSPSWISE